MSRNLSDPTLEAVMPNSADIEMAERRGWAAYINGLGLGQCPYSKGPEQEAWLRGYTRSALSPHAVL